MTDRPILFSAPMVRAILGGSKTQTRRLLKPQPDIPPGFRPPIGFSCMTPPGHYEMRGWTEHDGPMMRYRKLPYSPRDRLWVRETFLPDPPADSDAWDLEGKETYVSWSGTGGALDAIPLPLRKPQHVLYRATWATQHKWRWRPGIHMPRWASRLTLTVTNVRVQRLQDITDADALAEGIESNQDRRLRVIGWRNYLSPDSAFNDKRESFRSLWDSINGQREGAAWADNPWVIVITFTAARKNIDSPSTEKVAA